MIRFFLSCLFCCSLVSHSSAQNKEVELLHNINSSGTVFLDNTCRGISISVTPVLIAEPLGVLACGWARHDSTLKRRSYVIGASLLTAGIISTGLKYSVNRDRPFVRYDFIEEKAPAGSPSFPSGHTSAAFSVATSLSLALPKWYVIAPSYLWAAAVGYSRMELGVHYPTDVLAGAVIGAGSSLLCWKANQWLARKKK